MLRPNREQTRLPPHKDARLFVIVCEGSERERKYFEFFQRLTRRIRINFLEHVQFGASAPNHFISRAKQYEESVGAGSYDFLWFIADRDKWDETVLRDIESECKINEHWHLAISNPCFEVWLFMHLWDIRNSTSKTAKQFKAELNKKKTGGYKVEIFAPKIENAIAQAKKTDNQPKFFIPDSPGTKLYKLAEQMLEVMGYEWTKAKHTF